MIARRFWDGVSREWMTGRQAALVFGLAVAMTCLITCMVFGLFDVFSTRGFSRFLWNAIGIIGVFSAFSLWGAMQRFHGFWEESTGRRLAWMRLLLTYGMWYGAIVYFLFVYMPARSKIAAVRVTAGPAIYSAMSSPAPPPPFPQGNTKHGRVERAYVFLRFVVFWSWCVFALYTAMLFVVPKIVVKLLYPYAGYVIPLYMVLMMALTALFGLLRVVCRRRW
jgi:hypothetical protein